MAEMITSQVVNDPEDSRSEQGQVTTTVRTLPYTGTYGTGALWRSGMYANPLVRSRAGYLNNYARVTPTVVNNAQVAETLRRSKVLSDALTRGRGYTYGVTGYGTPGYGLGGGLLRSGYGYNYGQVTPQVTLAPQVTVPTVTPQLALARSGVYVPQVTLPTVTPQLALARSGIYAPQVTLPQYTVPQVRVQQRVVTPQVTVTDRVNQALRRSRQLTTGLVTGTPLVAPTVNTGLYGLGGVYGTGLLGSRVVNTGVTGVTGVTGGLLTSGVRALPGAYTGAYTRGYTGGYTGAYTGTRLGLLSSTLPTTGTVNNYLLRRSLSRA